MINKEIKIKLSDEQIKKLGIKKDKAYLMFEKELNKSCNKFIQSDKYKNIINNKG
jgi:hypothetical protein|tara:strand:+ start:867 stop:1031 length:165 start_codon:yes stop_codon:yes gene_type:complete